MISSPEGFSPPTQPEQHSYPRPSPESDYQPRYLSQLQKRYGVDFESILAENERLGNSFSLDREQVKELVGRIEAANEQMAYDPLLFYRPHLPEPIARDVMNTVRQRVSQECPFWNQLRTEFGYSPLDPDLTPKNLGRKVKYVDYNEPLPELQGSYMSAFDIDAVAIGGKILIGGEFPNPSKRLVKLASAEPPSAFTYPTLRKDYGVDFRDQTRLDVILHEKIHTKQFPAMSLLGDWFSEKLAQRARNRLAGVYEIQAYHPSGVPAAFIGNVDLTRMVASRYLADNYIAKEIKRHHENPASVSEDEFFARVKDYLDNDPNGDIKRALEGAVAIDRLYTIGWLKSKKARAEGNEPPSVSIEIAKLIHQESHSKNRNWAILNGEIEQFLKEEFAIQDQNDRGNALDALDTLRDAFHADQRREFLASQGNNSARALLGCSKNDGTAGSSSRAGSDKNSLGKSSSKPNYIVGLTSRVLLVPFFLNVNAL